MEKQNHSNRKTLLSLSFLVVLGAILATSSRPLPAGGAHSAIALAQEKGRLAATFANLPLSFEENRGQSDPEVQFLSRSSRSTLFLSSTGLALTLEKGARRAPDSLARTRGLRACWRPGCPRWADKMGALIEHGTARSSESATVLRMKWVGANRRPKASGLDELPGKSNYFIGSDPKQWRTNIPHYARVRYEEVYPGVDLIYYGNQRRLEFDFVVAPGTQPSAIQFDIEGAEKLEVDGEGRLLIGAGEEHWQLLRPGVYQETGAGRHEIRGGYRLLAANRVAFEVAPYDPRQPLVIDPVFSYSTYLGGSGFEEIHGIGVDSSGNVYVAGFTGSANFPTASPFRPSNAGFEDAFIAKLNPEGTSLLYSTYLGGSDTDDLQALAVGAGGIVTVVGYSFSLNFPTASPLQANLLGSADVIVARLNATGSALLYSTYLGGNGEEVGLGLSVDASGNAYLTGETGSGNFPLAAALQPIPRSTFEAFVTKLNPTGTALVYSTYLGGNEEDVGFKTAVDSSGNLFIVGATISNNFPLVNPAQATFGGGTCGTAPDTSACPDVFVTKLSAAGTFLYSTYLGGSGDDEGFAIALDAFGGAYVTGFTASLNFPTANPIQSAPRGLEDVFVTKLSAAGSSLVYSTYLGGLLSDVGTAIGVDGLGNAYVTGVTESGAFPTVNTMQSLNGDADAFVAALNQAGSALLYSTYLGGSNIDQGLALAVDAAGRAYVAGGTNSNDLPRRTPFQSVYGGGTCGSGPPFFACPDGFISKVVVNPALFPGGMVSAASFAPGAAVAPGSIVAAFGTDLTNVIAGAGAVPLPPTLAGITVRMNNLAAPLFLVSGGQINLQVPWELAGQSQASIVVTTGSATLSAITVNLAAAAPGIFTTNAQGTGQGAILIASEGDTVAAPAGSIPGRASRPANRGNVVTIYCTGLGNVTNRPATGAAASANPLSETTAPVSVTIGGVPASVSFAGLAPTFVGLYQINVQVPTNAPSGNAVSVVVSVGSATSNTAQMAVQ